MRFLRDGAILIAIAAALDPALPVRRHGPARVGLLVDKFDPDAAGVVQRLRGAVGTRVDFVHQDDVAAHVVVGNVRPGPAAFSNPVSVVALDDAPSVAIVDAPATVQANVNSETIVPVRLRGRGTGGQTTVVVLEERGVELSRSEYRWTGDGEAALSLSYLALEPGARQLTVRASVATGEHRLEDNRADILAMSVARPGLIAVVEPRPSWPAGFVRRALENDPAFHVASIIRTSIDIATRAGGPPPALTFEELAPFDAVIVGAPEALRRNELNALQRFAAERGGTVVLLPDQRPSGPYADLLPAAPAEQLLADARVLEPAGIPASEILTIPAARDITPLATLNGAPVVFSWPVGDGRFLFSGALDAWRYRADPRSRTLQFLRDTLMAASMGAPPPLRLEVVPGVVRPGAAVRVVARVRTTEFEATAGDDTRRTAAIEAHIIGPRGTRDLVRLHPTPDPGRLEGEVATSVPGVYSVAAGLANGARSETTFIAQPDASIRPAAAGLMDHVPAMTGGISASSNDLSPLVDHLARLARPVRDEVVHPMRSLWWVLLFSGLICAEWAIRRRRGLR